MVRNWRKVAWIAMVTLGSVTISGCKRPDTAGHARARTKTTLFSVCKTIWVVESFTEEPPPVKLPELIDWMEKHANFDDYQPKTIKDVWGNQIVVVSRAGKFVGVGSSGPDGIWQDGTGDDILVTLEDVKRE